MRVLASLAVVILAAVAFVTQFVPLFLLVGMASLIFAFLCFKNNEDGWNLLIGFMAMACAVIWFAGFATS